MYIHSFLVNNLAENGDCGWRVLRTGQRVRLFGTVLDVRCEDQRRVGLRFKHLSGIDGCCHRQERISQLLLMASLTRSVKGSRNKEKQASDGLISLQCIPWCPLSAAQFSYLYTRGRHSCPCLRPLEIIAAYLVTLCGREHLKAALVISSCILALSMTCLDMLMTWRGTQKRLIQDQMLTRISV